MSRRRKREKEEEEKKEEKEEEVTQKNFKATHESKTISHKNEKARKREGKEAFSALKCCLSGFNNK